LSENLSKVILALDTPDEQKAVNLVRKLKHRIFTYKVGSELLTSAGPDIVRKIVDEGCRVFLDLKFHDIPNTVAGAAKAAANSGAFMFNVHASGGKKMMETAKTAAQDAVGNGKMPLIIAVTVLTSLDESDLTDINVEKSPMDQAVALAKLARSAGMDGVVASPKEIAAIRSAVGRGFLIVTPGVRPSWAGAADQKRTMTPEDAIEAGADYIVIGRPVTESPNPELAMDLLFI